MPSLVLIDESYKKMDRVTARYAFGHVIIDESSADNFSTWLAKEIENDSLRFSLPGKLHFTELSPAQKDKLVEKVSKLPMTFKVYVTYINSSMATKDIKVDLLLESIRHHESNKAGSNYIVEHSSEYTRLNERLPGINVQKVNFNDNKSLLLADILLGVFCGFLDIQNEGQSTDLIKWHTLIYNQIRLEVIDYRYKTKLYLARDRKIL